MPNGDPNWGKNEFPQLEAFFAQIADVLEEFAETHNLKIDKYYHQFPDWSFQFRHPEGGIGQIEVRKLSEDSVKFYAAWWIDYLKPRRRDSKSLAGNECSLDKVLIKSNLEELFKTILSWKKTDLDKGSVFPEYGERITKGQHEKDLARYPFPKL